MNPFRSLAAWWRRRQVVRASEMRAGVAVPVLPGRSAPSALSPASADPRQPHTAAKVAGCQCGLCTGEITPEQVMRLTVESAAVVDACLVAVSAGSLKLGHLPLQWISRAGIGAAHVLVVSDPFFRQHLLPVLQEQGR